uniref:Uncharacterized protein n=1 Tax=Periophthalmus magnuspinnatus TaxID=409849 RepID=A0A3B3ZAM0_9GOBI
MASDGMILTNHDHQIRVGALRVPRFFALPCLGNPLASTPTTDPSLHLPPLPPSFLSFLSTLLFSSFSFSISLLALSVVLKSSVAHKSVRY